MDLYFASDGNLWEISDEEAWEAIENFAQGQKEWDNPPNIISEQEVANLKAEAKRLFGNKNVWVEMHRGIAWDKVENPNSQSAPQVLSSFEEYTTSVTYPKEVEETFGTSIEGNSNFDEPEPQPQPLPSCPSLDIKLGWLLKEIHMTWAHLEKKRTRLQLYTKSLKKLCIQSVETASCVSRNSVRTFEVTASEIW
nr:hypothetical protein [Tanacetum cinerariifolium]